eukprot:798459_1
MNKPTKKEDNPWWQYLESNDNQMDDDGVYQELIQNAGVFRWQCPHGFASGEHQGLMHLKPKYKNAKEEALHNTYNQLSVDSWNQTIRKSEQFNRSFARRRIKTKSKGKFEDQIVGVCSQWRQGDDIDLGEIVTLKLYTDFDKLQFQLKKCLRFDSNTDDFAMDVHSEPCKMIHFINAPTFNLRKIHFLNNYRFNNEALAGLKNDIWGVRVTESLFMMKNTDDAFQRIMNGKSVQLWLSWINLMFISVSLWRYQMSSRLSQPNDNYIFF